MDRQRRPHARATRRTVLVLLVACSLSCATAVADVGSHADATTPHAYYIGRFSHARPGDVPSCGTVRTPCATLGYWNKFRRQILAPGDHVRIAPGTYHDSGPVAGQGYHCILLDQFAKGVTYEGRTAHDEPLASSPAVRISLQGVSTVAFTGANPCSQRGIGPADASRCETAQWSGHDDYSGFVARDLTVEDARGLGIYLCGSKAAPPANVTFANVRVVHTQGVIVGAFDDSYGDPDCTSEGRTVHDVTFDGFELAGPSTSFPGGLVLACMDTARVRHAFVHDTGEFKCSDAAARGCDDHDGIDGSGAINVTVSDSEVTRVGEDGVDVGGHPGGKSHDWVVERVASHDNPGGNFKASGGQYVTMRNSMSWGRGIGYTSYSGAHDIRVVNNTFWGADRAVMMYADQTRSVFENNIFVTTGATPTVWLDEASTNPTNVWRSNVVANTGGGPGFAEFPGDELDRPACDGWNAQHTQYTLAFDISIVSNPPPTPCDLGVPAQPSALDANAAGLSALRSAGLAGMWFGANTAVYDRWGTLPSIARTNVRRAADLGLRPTDTVTAGGLPEPDVTVDFFGRPRPPGALRIGAG